MKKYIYLFLLITSCLFPNISISQCYTILSVKGEIILEKTGLPIKELDEICSTDNLIFSSKESEALVISPGGGKYIIQLSEKKTDNLKSLVGKVLIPVYEQLSPKLNNKQDTLSDLHDDYKLIPYVSPKFTQYSEELIKNPYRGNLKVILDEESPITILPGNSVKILIKEQKEIIFKVGMWMKTYQIQEYRPPMICIDKIGRSGEKYSLREVQDSVGFRVIICDNSPQFLSIDTKGPISIKQIDGYTYDISLNLFKDKESFLEWAEGKEKPYKISFTVKLTDRLSSFEIEKEEYFIFGKW